MDEQQSNKNTGSKADLSGLSIKDLFYKYVRFLPYFLLSVALALLLAFAYLRYTSRVYSASGNMLIKTNQQGKNAQSDKVEDLIMGGNKTQNIQSEIEIVKSRPLMARVVKKLGLQLSYTAKGRIRDQNVYRDGPFLMKILALSDSSKSFTTSIKLVSEERFRVNNESTTFAWGDVFRTAHGTFRLDKQGYPVAGSEYTLVWRPTDAVAASLAGIVGVQPKGSNTGILSISMEATNPHLAADIVNMLMIQYDSMTLEENKLSTDQKLTFIGARLGDLKDEIDSLQVILLGYRQKNYLIDVQTQSAAAFSKIEDAEKEIVSFEMRANIADYIEEYLKDKENKYTQVVVPSSLGLDDATLNLLVDGYNKAQLGRRSLLESNIPPANPAVKEAEALIEQQRQSVLENLRNIRSALKGTILTLRGNSNLETGQLKELPFKMKEILELERQLSTKLALYTLIEGKGEEAAIQRASMIPNSSVVQKATPSDVPVKPNKQMIQIIAFIAGLGLPALIIFLAEMFNDKITTRYDIERITDVPIIGEVGHSYSNKTLVVNRTSRSMVAEQFRTIRTNLDYVLTKAEKPVILVTSSFSGEGKSFVSTNMGAVVALTGKKTIVLEFDIRKPKVLSGLAMPKGKGISNYLVGKATVDEIIVPVPEQENLYVLPCGPIPPNPSELLLDSRIEDIFAYLRTQFDVIIIDTAPVGMVSDAMTLGKFADCTLYLTRQGHTYKKQIGLIDEIYRDKKLPRVTIVINDVKVKAGYGYYGYGRYGYGYGYGYGEKSGYYEEDMPKRSRLSSFFSKLNPGNWFKRKR